ncbi:DUF4189 domain-containing protein [bacterium]|nr:DUF4189 domain-containing protein [bacterium]
MHRLFLLALIVSTLSVTPAQSVNLHRKHGPGWDCSYITTGTPYKEACLACEAQGKQFDQRGDGGICVGGGTPNFPSPRDADYGKRESPRQPQYSSPQRQTTKKRLWGAIAGSVDRQTNGGVRYSIASSLNYNSESEASAAALQGCRSKGGKNCEVSTFNNGCAYIAGGTSNTGAGYGGSSTRAAAISKCQSQGLSCSDVVGGCVNQ